MLIKILFGLMLMVVGIVLMVAGWRALKKADDADNGNDPPMGWS